MNISIHLAVAVAAAACLCVVAAAPEGRIARTKQQRPTRGFKNVEMMTARGFGKRDRPHTRAEHQNSFEGHARKKFNPKSDLMVAYDFGKRSGNDESNDEVYGLDNFWEMLESPEREGQEGGDEKTLESIPLDWFVNEMLTNPDFARSVVRKFIDLNQDGMLSSEELLRNVV
ncbi:allatotropin-like isoform X2 [Trichoplusia ni]|uniref:Allatotropin-like isoform X2 n=1 Tax=Trichoplusia ni TaxID=7111 RepID=A0A7E5WB69_TRINI|nr:allatotropin-like isoform X2 [Trichoplusia ni]